MLFCWTFIKQFWKKCSWLFQNKQSFFFFFYFFFFIYCPVQLVKIDDWELGKNGEEKKNGAFLEQISRSRSRSRSVYLSHTQSYRVQSAVKCRDFLKKNTANKRRERRKKITPRLCSLGSTVWEQEKHLSKKAHNTP